MIPVNGSVLPWPVDDEVVPLEPVELEDPLASVEDDCDSEEPLDDEDETAPELEEDDEPELELEPELEPEDDDPLGCDVVLLPVSGSTYC